MKEILEKIGSADENQIQTLLMAVLRRYGQLYPDSEISVISLEKNGNQNSQLDDMIRLLQNMKK